MLNTYKKEIHFRAGLPAIIVFFLASFVFQIGIVSDAYGAKGESVFHLVSVGVGDIDLITVRAIDTIKNSDVIVCREKTKEKFARYLKGKEFLDSSRGRRYSKKDRSKLTDKEKKARLEERRKKREKLVSQIRLQIARGKRIAVLDSGDPLIYGPMAWYLEEFKDLNPVVIPGVSCFNAANAALGKCITSGEKIHSVVLTSRRDIEKMSGHQPTMVIFTMGSKFKDIIKRLKEVYPLMTPVGIVVYAGYKEKEKVIKGTLENIEGKVDDEKLPFEHLVYVGDFLTYCRK